MNPVFAERQLMVKQPDGVFEPGFVRLYAPTPARPDSAQTEWKCELHLAWPGHDQRQQIHGVDSYQALILAAKMAPAFVEVSEAYRDGRLFEHSSQPVPITDFELSFGFRPYGGKSQ